MDARPLPFRPERTAPGAVAVAFRAAILLDELPPGSMRRVSFGDLDVLLAHTPDGIAAVDDRCPHMAAPLSVGSLDGCVVSCPLHDGKFDLGSGDPVQMPTTGGLDPDGVYHPVWTPAGNTVKDDVPGRKATARRYTRVRRFQYYPVRIVEGVVQVAVPAPVDAIATQDQAPPAFLADPERATA